MPAWLSKRLPPAYGWLHICVAMAACHGDDGFPEKENGWRSSFLSPKKKIEKSPDKYQCFNTITENDLFVKKHYCECTCLQTSELTFWMRKKFQILGARTIRSLKETTKKSCLFCPSFSSGKGALYTLEKKSQQSPWNNPPKKSLVWKVFLVFRINPV